MQGDGSGWVVCPSGQRHWGRYGAAGLLLAAPGADGWLVLLQLRAGWSHQGGTWGLPGGARDSHESWAEAALREAAEETTLDPTAVEVTGEYVDDDCGWSYVTVLGRLPAPATLAGLGGETEEVRWVPAVEVAALPLHPRFAEVWPRLRDRLA